MDVAKHVAPLHRRQVAPKYGARHLKRAIERNLVHPLANLVATEQIHMSDQIGIDYEGELPKHGEMPPGKYVFTRDAEGVLVPGAVERMAALGAVGTAAPQSNRMTAIPQKKQFP